MTEVGANGGTALIKGMTNSEKTPPITIKTPAPDRAAAMAVAAERFADWAGAEVPMRIIDVSVERKGHSLDGRANWIYTLHVTRADQVVTSPADDEF